MAHLISSLQSPISRFPPFVSRDHIEDDLLALAESLDPGSSAVAMVFEHTWARQLAAAVRGSEGEVIFSERIPRDVVEAAVAVAKEALSA